MKIVHQAAQSFTHHKARRAGISIGRNVHISPGGSYLISKLGRIVLGSGVLLGRDHRLEVQDTAEIHIGANVRFHERIRIAAVGQARIIIEDNCFFHHDISIRAHTEIVIGRDSMFAAFCYLSDHNHRVERDALIINQGFDMEPLIVGCDVWLGIGATLLKGSRVGNGAVIAARAVVNKPVPEYEIWGGVPAKRIGERK